MALAGVELSVLCVFSLCTYENLSPPMFATTEAQYYNQFYRVLRHQFSLQFHDIRQNISHILRSYCYI